MPWTADLATILSNHACLNILMFGPRSTNAGLVPWQLLFGIPVGADEMPPTPSYDEFDCVTGYHDWANIWGESHQKYCCIHSGRACPPHDVPPKVIYHHVPVHMQPHVRVVPVPVPTPSHVVYKTQYVHAPVVHHFAYDCHAGYSNWYFGWSHHKKEWCCHHESRGCPGTWHGSYHLHVHVEHGVGHAHGHIYDCEAGYSNWMQGWSDSKKDWCCSHEHKGCVKYHCTGDAPRNATSIVAAASTAWVLLRLTTGTGTSRSGALALLAPWTPAGLTLCVRAEVLRKLPKGLPKDHVVPAEVRDPLRDQRPHAR